MVKVGSFHTFMISSVNGMNSEKSGTLQPIRYASASRPGLAAWAVLSEVTVQHSVGPANLPLRPAPPAGRRVCPIGKLLQALRPWAGYDREGWGGHFLTGSRGYMASKSRGHRVPSSNISKSPRRECNASLSQRAPFRPAAAAQG